MARRHERGVALGAAVGPLRFFRVSPRRSRPEAAGEGRGREAGAGGKNSLRKAKVDVGPLLNFLWAWCQSSSPLAAAERCGPAATAGGRGRGTRHKVLTLYTSLMSFLMMAMRSFFLVSPQVNPGAAACTHLLRLARRLHDALALRLGVEIRVMGAFPRVPHRLILLLQLPLALLHHILDRHRAAGGRPGGRASASLPLFSFPRLEGLPSPPAAGGGTGERRAGARGGEAEGCGGDAAGCARPAEGSRGSRARGDERLRRGNVREARGLVSLLSVWPSSTDCEKSRRGSAGGGPYYGGCPKNCTGTTPARPLCPRWQRSLSSTVASGPTDIGARGKG